MGCVLKGGLSACLAVWAVCGEAQSLDPHVIYEQKCAACHTPALPLPGGGKAAAYTDLLLHDLGDALADNRPEADASGREWRTPPLWGLGLVQRVNGHSLFLHDGRARGFAEAVLWHGGEAEPAREAFRMMTAADRAALVAFLESL